MLAQEIDVSRGTINAGERSNTSRQTSSGKDLLDIGLPGLDGYEVARRLRATADLSNIMLIAHSGYAGEDHFQRVKQAGFDHHLVKPANIAQLNELIASLVEPGGRPYGGS